MPPRSRDPNGPPDLPATELLREAIEALDCHYAIFAPDRSLVDFSASYAALHGAAFAAASVPMRYDDLMRHAITQTLPGAPPEDAAAELARRVAAHESHSPGEFDRLYPGGRWMRVSKRRLANGHVAGVAVDITALKHREIETAASEARYRALVDTAPVGIWHLDEDGRTLFANARLARLFGAEPASLSQSGLQPLAPAADGPFGFPPGHETEATIPARAGRQELQVLVGASGWLPIAGSGRPGAVLTLLDITLRKSAQAHADHLAWHDTLTGLGNRAQFNRALDQLPEARDGAVLLLIDLDHFKAVNDRHGHAAGDAVLCAAASRLRAALRPGDLACRLGGDEFAILAVGASASSRAESLSQRLAHILAAPASADGVTLAMSASIGHAAYPTDAPDARSLQRAADLALYAAKHGGRGRAVAFRPAFLETAERQRRVGEALAAAITNNGLHLEWRPQMLFPGPVLRGAGALVRWPGNPLHRGQAEPPSFLMEAQEAGLMPALDAWTLDAALHQAATWANEPGAPRIVAVSMGAATLRDPAFPARVAAALRHHGIAAPALEIDVTETAAMQDFNAIAPVLAALHALKVRLALASFGGGLSSPTYLAQLPVDLIKLDPALVAGLPGERERAILRAVVALASSLNLPVLATGVETDETIVILRRKGCKLMQGPKFGPALLPRPESGSNTDTQAHYCPERRRHRLG